MKFRGGYNLFLTGKPSGEIKNLPEPEVLYLPLFSPRFNFSQIHVEDGTEVTQGQVLANDPANHAVPLLAPRAGTVKTVDEERRLIILENVQKASNEKIDVNDDLPEKAKDLGDTGEKCAALIRLGAWQFVSDAFTGKLPDPYTTPQAVIVSTTRLEPFITGAETLLIKHLANFEQGLKHVHSMAADKPMYLVMPKNAAVSSRIRGIIGKNAWIKLIVVPEKYPFDNTKLCTQLLEGEHIKAIPGYSLKTILESYQDGSPTRMVNGGALTGTTIEETQMGLDVECIALTFIPEHTKRELLCFANPGISKHAFIIAFLGSLRPKFFERYTTGIRGEQRPCVTCCCCETVCPAGIMPHQIHKYVTKNRLEDAERIGLNLCVQCGLCTHVCPSKIEIKQGLLEAQETLLQERQSEEVHS